MQDLWQGSSAATDAAAAAATAAAAEAAAAAAAAAYESEVPPVEIDSPLAAAYDVAARVLQSAAKFKKAALVSLDLATLSLTTHIAIHNET